MEEKLYTINELSKQLHITRATLYSWIKAGKLPALRAGYKWLIRESDLERFLGIKKSV